MAPVIIKSSSGGRSLKFSERNGDYFRVDLEGDEITATKGIWGYTDSVYLVQLFECIAANWKGWDGEKKWSSIESDLMLTATSDNLGHITLEVAIFKNHPDNDWNISAPVHLDAGSLDKIAKDVATFFGD